jgi:hypothetical protein
MSISRRLATPATCAVAALALAGCSSFAEKSADEIKEATVADMQDVTSLTMDASLAQAAGELEMTISMDDEGDCLVTMQQRGGAAEILRVKGDEAFIKADAAFYEATGAKPAAVEMVAGKWVEYDVDRTDMCNLEDFLDDFDDDSDEDDDEGDEDGEDAKFEKGDESEVDGEAAIELVGEKDGETSTIWVATDGDHRVLKMETEGGDEPGTFLFSDYDEDVKTERPDDVVEVPKQ